MGVGATGTGFGNYIDSRAGTFSFFPGFFSQQTTSDLAWPVLVTSDGSNYYVFFAFNPSVGSGDDSVTLTLDSSLGFGVTGASLTLKVAGAADTVLPFYLAAALPAGVTATVTGSVIIDFNSFWTP